MILEKELSTLSVGEYVIDIVQQTGTYTLTSAGHIKNQNIIAFLEKKGVISVLVDTEKAIKKEPQNNGTKPKAAKQEKTQSPVVVEIKQAKRLFNDSKNIQRPIHHGPYNLWD